MTNPPGWTSPGSGSHPDDGAGNQPGNHPGGPAGPPPGGPPPGYGPPPGNPPPGYGPPPGFGPPEPKPGIIPLRPIGLGEILDGAVTYIRQNPAATLGISAIIAAATQIIITLGGLYLGVDANRAMAMAQNLGFVATLARIWESVVAFGLTIVLSVAGSLLLTGMLTTVVGRAVLGQHTTIGEAWRQTLPRLPALVGVSALLVLGIYPAAVALAGGVLVTPGVLVVLYGNPVLGGFLIFLGSLGLLAVLAWIYVLFSLATPAIVLERAGLDALRRSVTLVRGSWWRTFGILLLTWIIAGIIGSVFQIPFGLAQQGVTYAGSVLIGLIVATVGGILATTVVSPFRSGVPALLYVDMRMRREGFDMQLQNAAGMSPPGPQAPQAPPQQPPPHYGPQPPPPDR